MCCSFLWRLIVLVVEKYSHSCQSRGPSVCDRSENFCQQVTRLTWKSWMLSNNERTKGATLVFKPVCYLQICKVQHIHRFIVTMHIQPHATASVWTHDSNSQELCKPFTKPWVQVKEKKCINPEQTINVEALHFSGTSCSSILHFYKFGEVTAAEQLRSAVGQQALPKDLIVAHLEPLNRTSSILLSSSQENKNHTLKSPI